MERKLSLFEREIVLLAMRMGLGRKYRRESKVTVKKKK